jgi:hypothetical protein
MDVMKPPWLPLLLGALLALLAPSGSARAQDMQFRIQPFSVIRKGGVTPQMDLLVSYSSRRVPWLGASSYTYISPSYALSYAGPEFYPAKWAIVSTYLGLGQGPSVRESWRIASFVGFYGKWVRWTALLETGGTGPWIGTDLRGDIIRQRLWISASYRRFIGVGPRAYVAFPLAHERTFALWAGYAPWDPEHPDRTRRYQFLLGGYVTLQSTPAPVPAPTR